MLEPGQNVGPYQLQGQLGAGGMGEVYRALDTRMGRLVAIKILPDALAGDEERRRRFEQEARLAAALNHPNVMAIYDVGLDQHPPYLVSELVPGESLRALISKGPIAVRKVVDIAAQIAAGLAAAHAAGIVHRDLKPENVMVTPEGSVKVLDFGVARMQAKPAAGNTTVTIAQTAMGSVVGTAAYMSPEQARAEEVDHRSDQFSMGLVLYEMLSLKQAFVRPSAIQTMSAIVEDDAPPLDRPVPAQLRWILERCLAKERDGRYESTRDLARELAYLRDHYGEATGAATGAQPAVPAAPRRVSVRALLLCAIGGALVAWCAAMLGRDTTAVELSHYRQTPFGRAFNSQTYSAWSPDGKTIAFLAWNETGKLQLFVQGLEAATPMQLTPPDAVVNTGSSPFWSPDSRAVYFRCSIGDTSGICRIPAGGGEAVMVQPKMQAASISRDGKTLAMWPAGTRDELAIWTATPPDGPAKKYAPMPFRAAQYYNNPSIGFTPDGKQILACVALDTRGETCWLLPWPAGTGTRVFAENFPFTFTPQFSWMPDSRHVVFSDNPFGTLPRLYIGDVKGGSYWPILAEDRPVTLPSVSPDGSRVAYTSVLSHSDIMSVPLGDGPVSTVIGGSRSEMRVQTSPVAQQIIYVTDRRGVGEVWIKSLTEGWERPLLTPNDIQTDGEPAQQFFNPIFSPDGRRVAVGVKSRSGAHLYTVFASGGTPVRATSSNDLELCATWSPDGNWLAYSAVVGPNAMLMKVRPGSGQAPVKVANTYGAAAPVWSPDGAWIADHAYSNLVLVSPDGQRTRRLPGDEGPVAWSRDSRTLYQVRGSPPGLSAPALYAIDIATGKERKLRDLPDLEPYANGNPGLSAGLTLDQKNIVYTVNRPRTEIWILDGIRPPSPWYLRLLGK